MRSIASVAALAAVVGLQPPAAAQQSASYRVEEHNLNAGGHPSSGISLSSASYQLSLGAVGEGTAEAAPSSASYSTSAGFVGAYPPPGEVIGLLFQNPTTLAWSPERSVGSYNLYRGLLTGLRALDFGSCLQSSLPDETAVETGAPPSRDGYFYLVTAVNLLDEEGTKGHRSDGTERTNAAPCP